MSRRERRIALAFVVVLGALLAFGGAYASKTERTTKKLDPKVALGKVVFGGPEADNETKESAQNKAGISNEGTGELEYTAAEYEYATRAYPADDIPASATMRAFQTWQAYKENKDGSNKGQNANQPFVWDLIGPTMARQPGVLSFTGAPQRVSGRTIAMVITPTCTSSRCRLWIGTAGGGVWRTDNPLSPDPKWTFVSGSFRTNAIGTLDQDPSDPTGNTIYAGTGEPNASGDSEAGVGIYKTTNGGDSWTYLAASNLFATRSIGKIAIDPTNKNTLYVGIARGSRGITSVSGGAISRTGVPGFDGPDQAPLGVFKSIDGGASFFPIWDAAGSIRGVSDVELDPLDPTTVYATAFQRGIWRMSPSKGEPAFVQVFAPGSPAQNTNRTQIDATVIGGATRIYATDGALGPITGVDAMGQPVTLGVRSALWRVDGANTFTAAALLASQASNRDGLGWDIKTSDADRPRANPYRSTYNFCTGQCWYDQDVYTPTGQPNTVFVIGSYSYAELRGPSNARAVLYCTNAGDPDPTLKNGHQCSDLTWDNTPEDQPDGIHPDEHEILVNPSEPTMIFESGDGGIIRTDGTFDDNSDECAERPLGPDSMSLCQSLLSRIPHQTYDTLNKGLSTLQFQSISLNPTKPLHSALAGTQDNGTWEWNSQLTTWDQTIYGDGGQSGFNYCDDQIRFNTFFTQYTDQNFRGGKPTAWVVQSGPLFPPQNGGESAPFYMAENTDPVNCGPASAFPQFGTPAAVAANANTFPGDSAAGLNPGPGTLGTIGFQYAGLNHVWRTVDNGGPQAYLEANCPEFITDGADPRCGDWKPLGGPPGRNVAGDLTGTTYGADRRGGNVVAVERTPGNAVTMWNATGTGRVFVTNNVNAVDPNSVQFCRVDNRAPNSPPRFVSSIHTDPNNPNKAWISYSGYNSTTPDTRGHVFEVTITGDPCAGAVVFRDLNVEQGADPVFEERDGDIPITDLVRDDLNGDLYAATDFGVLRSAQGLGSNWTRAGSNLPFVETPGLTIDPCSRVLYAATHGRSIWRMFLPGDGPNPPGLSDARCVRQP